MEVYALDRLLRRIRVFDMFESLIWTERFNSIGDFELVLPSTSETRRTFRVGLHLAINESYRVMVVESVENSTNSDGKSTLTVKGRSLESILDDRVAKDTMSNLTVEPKWNLTGTPAAICRQIFNDICVTGNLSPADIIPFVQPGDILPEDTIPEPIDELIVALEPTTVYQAIKDLCDLYGMGFRLIRNFDLSQLYFAIYMGSDRTSQQSILPPVVFSPDFDNLQNTTEFVSTSTYKNIAYVFSNVGVEVVASTEQDPDDAGFERRVLMVEVTDVPDGSTPAVASAYMIQKGLEGLTEHRRISGFDGELNQHSQYKYGIDYSLGDLVEQRSDDGITNIMQVTEQIFVCDAEGERAYPTLTINNFVTPGSWATMGFRVWEDMLPTEFWNTMP